MTDKGRDAATSGYRHPDPVTDEALDWFLRLDEDRSPATLAAFDRWCSSDPARAQAFDELVRLHAMPALQRATLADAERLRAKASPAARTLRKHKARRSSGRWLAGLSTAAVLLVSVLHPPSGLILRWRADYATATGERQTVTLPDGSSVLLDTASAIATDFRDGRRMVQVLAGEAFFDVRHDPDHPFVVDGHFAEVTVTGTAFSVRADDTEDQVVLERGSVDVRPRQGVGPTERLNPGQMVTANQSGITGKRPADTARTLAWRDGRIVFDDRPLREAVRDLGRYYDGSVILLGERIDIKTVSGNYRTDDPETAIRTLAVATGISMTRLPAGILILR